MDFPFKVIQKNCGHCPCRKLQETLCGFFLIIIYYFYFFETKQMALASNIEDLPTQNRGAGTLYVGRRIILDTFQGMCASKR